MLKCCSAIHDRSLFQVEHVSGFSTVPLVHHPSGDDFLLPNYRFIAGVSSALQAHSNVHRTG